MNACIYIFQFYNLITIIFIMIDILQQQKVPKKLFFYLFSFIQNKTSAKFTFIHLLSFFRIYTFQSSLTRSGKKKKKII